MYKFGSLDDTNIIKPTLILAQASMGKKRLRETTPENRMEDKKR